MENPGKEKEVKKVKRPTQEKRQIQNEKCRLMNKGTRTRVKTSMKSCLEALLEKDAVTTQAALNTFCSLVDKAAKKGLFKVNKSSRMKSRMALKVAALTRA